MGKQVGHYLGTGARPPRRVGISTDQKVEVTCVGSPASIGRVATHKCGPGGQMRVSMDGTSITFMLNAEERKDLEREFPTMTFSTSEKLKKLPSTPGRVQPIIVPRPAEMPVDNDEALERLLSSHGIGKKEVTAVNVDPVLTFNGLPYVLMPRCR